jgi:hypothetical protein
VIENVVELEVYVDEPDGLKRLLCEEQELHCDENTHKSDEPVSYTTFIVCF